KLYTGKSGFISTLKGFHGKSLGALSLLGKAVFRKPLLPLLDGVRQVPFGDADAIEQELKWAKEVGDDIAGVVVEPIQGEAGAIEPPDDYWPKLRQICDEYEVLLIADEVQTGFGRTGKLFGVDHWGVTPDIMCFGKGLGGGVPIGVVMTSLKDVLGAGDHGSTFGGNYLSATAACSVIDILDEYKASGKLDEGFKYFAQKLEELFSSNRNLFTQKVGIGMMCGLRCKNADTLTNIMSSAKDNGVMVLKAGRNTLRFLPPLTITKEEIDEGFKSLNAAVSTLK
ncbi:MAG: aminotransferase class III-fold pyridoxal phosphate-dependent enzyme, partial [Campylobacterota bacterium]